ncbi:Uncharacterised protein [uncultured Roseburia sp.]|uniref:Lipoprotein n=1 Tax=Brotonthovivens ammoniilytica TaxID=2981725 RepID=A0ABT2THA3_9FIRM|nr:hypothetical protein [Brotonthovivens ammoniilytica]MCU6761563.1 hypothetical protein [Brotonthovivens ammoniilytica]SCI32112.1 Uncharacterised protein [uncultured Roseburia sp.]
MKKPIIIVTLAAAGAFLLAGCGSLKVDSNTISVQKNGKIMEGLVEDFSKEYYDEEELKAYIDQSVEDYAAENEKGDVKVSGYKVEDQKAYLTLKYKNTDSYGKFNGVDIFNGTIVKAQAEGYDFDASFTKVEDGEAKGSADTKEVTSDDKLNVLILRENMNIIVPGTIQYVSADGVKVTAKDTVEIEQKSDTAVAPVVYVIYK